MLKNKTKIVAILLALFVMFSFTFSFAVTEEDARDVDPISVDGAAVTSDDDATITLDDESESVENQATETEIKEEDVYLTGDDVVVDYDVNGNLFVMAKSVTITSQIGGDVFVMAQDFNLNGGYIYSNLFVLAKKANINGIVYDVYGATNTLTIGDQGYVYRDVHIGANTFNVFGAVGRNAFVDCNNLSFVSTDENSTTANGVIYGNLSYSSNTELEGIESYVEGDVSFDLKEISKSTNVGDVVLSLVTSLVFLVVIWLLAKWIKPSFITNSRELVQNKLPITVAVGLLVLIVIPIVTVILFILNVTSTVGFLLLGLYFLIMAISTATFVIAIADIASKKNNKTNNFFIDLLMVVVVGIILYLLKLIPYVGGFLSFVYVVTGFILILKQIIPGKKSTENKEETKTEVID